MIGGADRDRTDDPLLAKQVLSQLSYSPRAARARRIEDCGLRIEEEVARAFLNPQFSILNPEGLVGLGRFELPTSRLSGVRSNQLSYRPAHVRSIAGVSHLITAAFRLS